MEVEHNSSWPECGLNVATFFQKEFYGKGGKKKIKGNFRVEKPEKDHLKDKINRGVPLAVCTLEIMW